MSIFGNGFIAKNLKKIKFPKKFDIYAAGVSDSNLKGKKNIVEKLDQLRNIYQSVTRKRF